MATVRHSLREEPSLIEESAEEEAVAPAWFAVTRATACFVGAFTLLTLLGELRMPGFNSAEWWIDFYPLPKPAARGLLALSSILFIIFSLKPTIEGGLKRLTVLCGFALLGAAIWNTYRFYQHLPEGKLAADMPMPFALHAGGCLAVILSGLLTANWERFHLAKDAGFGLATHAVCIVGFPLAIFFCMGRTDDRRPADALVVLVCEPQNEKHPSQQAAERMKAIAELAKQQKIDRIVLVADAGDEAIRLRDAIRGAASSHGIDAAHVLSVEPSTDARREPNAQAAEIAKLLKSRELKRALVFGPFYRLPRIKLGLQRSGLETHTVPTIEKTSPKELRESMLRESAAIWTCYLQPILM